MSANAGRTNHTYVFVMKARFVSAAEEISIRKGCKNRIPLRVPRCVVSDAWTGSAGTWYPRLRDLRGSRDLKAFSVGGDSSLPAADDDDYVTTFIRY